jgi:hypothetical protein
MNPKSEAEFYRHTARQAIGLHCDVLNPSLAFTVGAIAFILFALTAVKSACRVRLPFDD